MEYKRGQPRLLGSGRLVRRGLDRSTAIATLQAAFMAVLNHPGVTTVIPGAKSPEQVMDQVKVSGQKISPQEKASLDPA